MKGPPLRNLILCWLILPEEEVAVDCNRMKLRHILNIDTFPFPGMELDFTLGTGDFQYYPYLPEQELSEMSQMPRSTLL